MTIPKEAIEAGARAIAADRAKVLVKEPSDRAAYVDRHWRSYSEFSQAALTAALPHLEKQIREDERKACIKLAGTFCWNRYKNKDLSSPAVFTSHTWQYIQEAIEAERTIAIMKGE